MLTHEIARLKTELVSKDELMNAIDENEKMQMAYLTDNDLPYYYTYYESLGLGYDYVLKISDIMRKEVSPEDIKRVANKYFTDEAVIISIPDDSVNLMVK